MPGSGLQDFLSSGQVPPDSIWLSKTSNCCPQQYHTHPHFGEQCFHRYFPAIHLHCTLASLSFPDKWGLCLCFILAHLWDEREDPGYQLNFGQGLYLRSSPWPWSLPEPQTVSAHTQDTKTRAQDILTCLLMWSICRSVEQRVVLCFVSIRVPFNYLHWILWHLSLCNCLKVYTCRAAVLPSCYSSAIAMESCFCWTTVP